MINLRRDSRHPFEVFLVSVLGLAGSVQLLSNETPSTIAKVASPGLQTTWSLLLLLGAAVCLFGIAWRDEATGLYFELAGLLGMACGTGAYGVSVYVTSPAPSSSIAAPFSIGFAAACVVRCAQIRNVLKAAIAEAERQGDRE